MFRVDNTRDKKDEVELDGWLLLVICLLILCIATVYYGLRTVVGLSDYNICLCIGALGMLIMAPPLDTVEPVSVLYMIRDLIFGVFALIFSILGRILAFFIFMIDTYIVKNILSEPKTVMCLIVPICHGC